MEQNPNESVSTDAEQGDSHVPGPPESPYIVWVVDSDNSYTRGSSENDGSSRSAHSEDTGSETDSSNRTEEHSLNPEETDSSDTEIVSSPPSVVNEPLARWEQEGDPALNLNSVIIIERESDIVQEPSVVSIPENPNAGVENPIIRLENPDYEPEEVADNESSRGSNKRSYSAMMSEDDDGQTCPVCLDVWTNSGGHRLSSLKCGHLFGMSCISRWLSIEKKKYCPQCNKKAHPNDIRELYATKLIAADSTEQTRLERELEAVKAEKQRLELDVVRSAKALEECKSQIELLQKKVAALEGDTESEKRAIVQKPEIPYMPKPKFHLEKTYVINEGACRVFAFSPLNNVLIVSHQIRTVLFRGYGIKRISKNGTMHAQSSVLHKKALRDMCFHPTAPNLVLSVSFDRTAKLTNIEENRTVQTFQTDNPLWSCCWDQGDTNIFYTGAGNGVMSVYDIRRSSQPITNLPPVEDIGAVVALRYAPPSRNTPGAVLCCRFNSVMYYKKETSSDLVPIPLDGLIGPFFSLSYNSATQHILVSCRPSVANPSVRHVYCELNGPRIEKINSFHGGNRQTLLSRSCFVNIGDHPLCAVFQESTSSIDLWSTATFSRYQSLPVSDHVLDLMSIRADNRNFLGSVSDSVVRLFETPARSV